MYRYLFALIIPLAACTPHEQCVARHTKETRTIDDLIAKTAGDIERGYALEERRQMQVGLVLCTNPSNNIHFCTSRQSSQPRKPVAIDLAVEKRKLAQLKARRLKLHNNPEAQIAACEAAIK